MIRATSLLAALLISLIAGPVGALAAPPSNNEAAKSTPTAGEAPSEDDFSLDDIDIDELANGATIVGTVVAVGALAEVIRRTAKERKDSRTRELLNWSANTGTVLQEARLLTSEVQPASASVTGLRELSEKARTLAAGLSNQATALAMLPKDAPPSNDLPHQMSMLMTELRLLTSESLRASSDCADAENPNPSPDAIAGQWKALASKNCSEDRDLVGKRLAKVTEAATDALSQFQAWVREMDTIDDATRKQLLRLAGADATGG